MNNRRVCPEPFLESQYRKGHGCRHQNLIHTVSFGLFNSREIKEMLVYYFWNGDSGYGPRDWLCNTSG